MTASHQPESKNPDTPRGRRSVSRVIDRNIRALLEHRIEEERAKGREERIADRITGFAGSMRFVYLHLVLYGAWIIINLGWVPPIPRFDPTFVVLAMVASVEAIFVSTFVLISQNRMSDMESRRADFDLQINLLSEHETTRLIALVRRIAQQMGIEEAHDPELDELARGVQPEKVLEKMDVQRATLEQEIAEIKGTARGRSGSTDKDQGRNDSNRTRTTR